MLRRFEDEARRFAELVAATPADSAVPTCPGWTLTRLVVHQGSILHWARALIDANGEYLDRRSLDIGLPGVDASPQVWADWLLESATLVIEALERIPDDTPTWTWGDGTTAAWWTRRLLHETAVHRIDAELAAGNTDWTIDAEVAIDAIDEHLANVEASGSFCDAVTHLRGDGSIHLHTTDLDGEWLIDLNPHGFTIGHGPRAATTATRQTVAARGTARDLLAAVTNRASSTNGLPDGLQIFGEPGMLVWWFTNSALT